MIPATCLTERSSESKAESGQIISRNVELQQHFASTNLWNLITIKTHRKTDSNIIFTYLQPCSLRWWNLILGMAACSIQLGNHWLKREHVLLRWSKSWYHDTKSILMTFKIGRLVFKKFILRKKEATSKWEEQSVIILFDSIYMKRIWNRAKIPPKYLFSVRKIKILCTQITWT